jgi:hypothetical protein
MSSGPHARIPVNNDRDRLLAAVLDRLWERYRERVAYVQRYEEIIAAHGATFVNDHIAFRTLALQQPLMGIISVSRPFEALGYVPAGCYQFPDKHLSAIHFQHPNGLFPKLFISELQTWKLGDASREIVHKTVVNHPTGCTDNGLRSLHLANPDDHSTLVECLVNHCETLQWPEPSRTDVEAVNHESQYAAWVLVHGYNVNHFTALINSHGVQALADIDQTVAALRAAGVPMKAEIEGAPGSRLRQTATEAVTVDVNIREGTLPWSYAYFELAERGNITDPDTGRTARFEGFLGPQATQLFEMTRVQ